MKNKLIICSPQLGLSPQSNLGGEVHDRETIKALCDLGTKVVVILPKNKPYPKHKNLKVYYLPFSFVYPPFLFNFLIIPWLFWLHKKEKFNILRIHSPYFVGLGGLIFKLFCPKIPLVVTYHHLEEKKCLFNLINKYLAPFWDKVIVVSQFTKKELITQSKINKNKIVVAYNGVDKKYQKKNKRKDLIKKYKLENKKVLMFLGQLEKRKNPQFLLKITKSLKIDNFKLLICGKGNLFDQLKKEIKIKQLENKAVLTGFIPEKEKVDYYNLADVLVYPSRLEGFGLSVLEAAACGVPAIVSNNSALKEVVVDNKTGYLGKYNNLKDWQNKVIKLIKNDKLRKKMALEARKWAQKFSWRKTARENLICL